MHVAFYELTDRNKNTKSLGFMSQVLLFQLQEKLKGCQNVSLVILKDLISMAETRSIYNESGLGWVVFVCDWVFLNGVLQRR